MLVEINDLVKNFGITRKEIVNYIQNLGYFIYEIYENKLYKILDLEQDKRGGYNYLCVPFDKHDIIFQKVKDLVDFL